MNGLPRHVPTIAFTRDQAAKYGLEYPVRRESPEIACGPFRFGRVGTRSSEIRLRLHGSTPARVLKASANILARSKRPASHFSGLPVEQCFFYRPLSESRTCGLPCAVARSNSMFPVRVKKDADEARPSKRVRNDGGVPASEREAGLRQAGDGEPASDRPSKRRRKT